MSQERDDLSDNPFARLFPSKEEAQKFSEDLAPKLVSEIINHNNRKISDVVASTSENYQLQTKQPSGRFKTVEKKIQPTKIERVNNVAETIFGITVNKDSNKQLVYLCPPPDSQSSEILITIPVLEQVLFQRLLLQSPIESLLNKTSGSAADEHIVQTNIIRYLYEAYRRVNRCVKEKENVDLRGELDSIKGLVLRNVATALLEPQLYVEGELAPQLFNLFYDEASLDLKSDLPTFFEDIVTELKKEVEYDSMCQVFKSLFDHVQEKITNANIHSFELFTTFSFLQVMANNKVLGEMLLDHSTPSENVSGNFFSSTLLGGIFCFSCLPKVNGGMYQFSLGSSIQTASAVESTIWASLDCICDNLHQLFLSLLKLSPTAKHKTLKWLSVCLHANESRGKLSNSHLDPNFGDIGSLTVPDGFMLNLGAVLLRLCQPFISQTGNAKILKIDPTYCAARCETEEERQAKNHHMLALHNETWFIPSEDSHGNPVARPVSESFNFVTECFFLAQKCIDLGFRVCVEKLIRLNQELGRVQRAYNDAAALGGANRDLTVLELRMEADMTMYLSLKAALTEPKSLDLLAKLHVSSAAWLIQVLLEVVGEEQQSSYALTSMKPLVFPLPETVPRTLMCLPEFILENLICFLTFVKNFHRITLEENGSEFLETILSCIIVFMGSCKRIRNPHLRAGLAECLESLLPNNDEELAPSSNRLSTMCREQLFNHHPHASKIIPSLLDVFVGIEMTGQSVQFEQKFNYRRPMYIVMDYLWSIEKHRRYFKELAKEAEMNMEAINPPLFLRFLNLLINDSVFLLDEALSNMAQLKAMQTARDSGEWAKLQPREREENETLFQHTRMIARFDNILGRWSIHTLEYLTSEITDIFCHPVMVGRIAAMLNYFLLNLVGPNKKNFKVKDKDEYGFRPDVFVVNICRTYINLKEGDSFCLAVSQDGRSYSPNLFTQAEDVLARIGVGGLIADLKSVAEKVSKMAAQQKVEEEILSDAPDEFLDPIMSTLMTDPVILPSSHVVIDRSTIARHLLSDQSDPFNRSPLTMDMIKPNDALRNKIENWMKQKKNQSPGSSKD